MPMDEDISRLLEKLKNAPPIQAMPSTELDDMDLRLSRAGVPERERDLLMRAARGKVVLRDTVALVAVRSAVSSLLVLAGARGAGKTLAACYALREMGGAYLTAYQFTRPGLDMDALKIKACVVVDQLGRENVGASDFCLSQLEELIDARYANRKLTVLVGNLTRDQFLARYGGIIDDRLSGDGAFVVCLGVSMRREQP